MPIPIELQDYVVDHPEVQSLSDTELDLLVIYFLAKRLIITLPDDLNEFVDSVACNRCWTSKRFMQNWVARLWFGSDLSDDELSELMEKVKCLRCADPKTIEALKWDLITNSF